MNPTFIAVNFIVSENSNGINKNPCEGKQISKYRNPYVNDLVL